MKKTSREKTLKVCSRGHEFNKSSDCPVCPVCWKNYYNDQVEKGSLEFVKLSGPAMRALVNAKIKTVKQLAKYTEAQILELHGMGPASLPTLRKALKAKKLAFKKEK
jgi:DNA-directed RNA polymerase alpha subunit